MIDVSLFLVILIYLLVNLIYLLTVWCLLGDSKQHSKGKRNFEDIFNKKKRKRYIQITKMSDTSITVIYHTMSLTVLYSQTCLKGHLYSKSLSIKGSLSQTCLKEHLYSKSLSIKGSLSQTCLKEHLYSKSLSIKGSLTFPIYE